MKLPISWLKDFVDVTDTPQGLAERLTFSGVEVEGIETIGSAFDGVVVGEVLTVDRHPNADKLTLCAVELGGRQMTVVCGAPNVKAGGKYPFAPVGTTLPNGMRLKKAKIRGVESEGMLCAEDELGLSQDHSGLMTLDAQWAPGTPFSKVMGPPETVLDLEITPNRPDCLCVIGLAREVATLYGLPLRIPEIRLAEAGRPAAELTRVEIEDSDGCPRYTARILTGVKIGPSPDWMKRRLELSGIRAINNVVDITNYVMLECGQPLHAFDQTLIEEGRIVVRRARAGEKMATLDGIERPISPDMLTIADARKPVAVAGVMGGAGSDIRDDTKTVLLESACFKPVSIRSTSRKLGMSTESSYRFERGVDPAGCERASRRAAELFAELAGATPAPGVVDVYPKPAGAREVEFRHEKCRDLLGVATPPETVVRIFEALGLTTIRADADGCRVRVPSFRGDLEREVDLIEEVARIHGLDKIPSAPPRAELVPGADDRPVQAVERCRACLVGLGLTEVMNYSYTSTALLDLFNAGDAAQRVALPNPLSADHAVLRNSLIPQMVETLGRNAARQIREAAFFEMGRVYETSPDGSYREDDRICLGLMGPVGRTGLDRHKPVSAEDIFLWSKGIWERLLAAMGVQAWELKPAAAPFVEDGQAIELCVEGRAIGLLGIVRSSLRKEWRLSEPVAILEASLAPMLTHVHDGKSVSTPAAYPSINRDMALIVSQEIRHEDILRIVKISGIKNLEHIELFDIFTGEGISAGKKSMAYSLTYRSRERTLTDEEANRYHEAVKAALKKELNAEVREG